ncbi:MAG: hypothetical protein JWQ71_2686 [Pedosphaera sp.]|nr:hypothetical protein [Pedosphaera sp.]
MNASTPTLLADNANKAGSAEYLNERLGNEFRL